MANVKISALPAVTTVVPGSDVLPLVSGGITTKATPNQIVQAVLPAPGAIGGTTPNAGAFTTLSASSTVSGTGFSTYLASPPAIGGTVAAAITGTTITANTAFAGALNGTVGATTPNTGAFTTLSASSTVSGTGFSTYLASPPAIGGTTAAAGKFTTLEYTSTLTGGTGVIAIGTNQIYKDTSGNVGIGTSSPLTKTNISGGAGNVFQTFTDTTSSYQHAYVGKVANALTFGFSSSNVSFVAQEGMRLDSSGNLGLGVTPSAWGSATRAIEIGASSSISNVGTTTGITVGANVYNNSGWKYKLSSELSTLYTQYNGTHSWSTAPSGTAGNAISFTQAMTLTANGNLLVGMTSDANNTNIIDKATSGNQALYVRNTATSGTPYGLYIAYPSLTPNTSGAFFIACQDSTAFRYYVASNGDVYAKSASNQVISDVRLKENIRDLDFGLAQILKLKPRRFDWKLESNKTETDVSGFIAQEVEDIIPEMIIDWGDDGYKGLNNSPLFPILVKAIQELSQEIETLKAKVNA